MCLVDDLISAAERGDVSQLDKLTTPLSDVIRTDLNGATSYLASHQNHSAVELLVARGATKSSAMRGYVIAGDIQTVQIYLDQGVDINDASASGSTALILTARHGNVEMVTALLDRGADVNVKNNDENTAIILAARDGFTEIIPILLAHGANIDEQNSEGQTALFNAARKNHSATVKVLLEKGADLEIKDNTQNTPFMLATRKGLHAIIKLLLQYGAKVHDRSDDDNTVLMIAAYNGYPLLAQTLLNHGARLEDKDNDGDTAFILAALEGEHEVVNALLNYIMTPNVHLLAAEFLQEEVEKLIKINDYTEYQNFTLLRDSLHLYQMMKNKNFNAAKHWLETHSRLFLHFTLDEEGSLYHLVMANWERNPKLMAEILTLLTEKHQANPYLPDKNGETAIDVLLKKCSQVPAQLFAKASHQQLHQLLNPDVMVLLKKVLVSGFLPNETMVSPAQQVQLLHDEIASIIKIIQSDRFAQPKQLLEKLKSLQPHPSTPGGFRMQMFPMKLTSTEHDNLQIVHAGLQKINNAMTENVSAGISNLDIYLDPSSVGCKMSEAVDTAVTSALSLR